MNVQNLFTSSVKPIFDLAISDWVKLFILAFTLNHIFPSIHIRTFWDIIFLFSLTLHKIFNINTSMTQIIDSALCISEI